MVKAAAKLSSRRPREHCFTIRGEKVSLSRNQVIERLRSIEPGVATEHVVEVGGVWYPVKKALAAVTGIDILRFQTAQALTVFEKLGFKVDRMSNQRR